MQLSPERRMVGALPGGLPRHRNYSGSSTSALSTASSGSGKLSPPLTPTLISLNDSTFTNSRESRKLDRSLSEPCDRISGRNANINSSRYKTELCRPFEESGYCKYADKCQFAHGVQELRNLARHPKYKTEPCRTFHTTAFCPYGSRCHFIHNEEERNQPIPPKHISSMQSTQFSSKAVLPGPVQRPKTINLSLTSLTSPSESSSSSGTGSPSLSPTFFGEDLSSDFIPVPTPLSTATTTTAPVNLTSLQDQTLASLIAPINIQTQPNLDSILNNHHLNSAFFQQQLNYLLNQRNNTATTTTSPPQGLPVGPADSPHGYELFGSTPSPPESVSGDSLGSTGSGYEFETCGSPLDVSKGLRLPVFSQLSLDD